MTRGTFARSTTLFLLVAGLGACQIFPAKGDGPTKVNDLVGSIERVYVDAEVAKETTRTAVDKLQALVASDFEGDAMTAYADFVLSVERSEKQAERLRDSFEPMQDAAGPVFEKWAKSLDEFASPQMRERSETRLTATRMRYDSIVAAVEPALATYDALNQGLRDHALFLSHDFNPASLAVIQDDVRNLAGLARQLDKRLNESMLASRAYVEAAALPVRPIPEETVTPVAGRRPWDRTEEDDR